MNRKVTVLSLFAVSMSLLVGCNKAHVHQYDTENVAWEWKESTDGRTYISATATFTCPKCKETVTDHSVSYTVKPTASQTVRATCTTDGTMSYTASVSFEEQIFSDTRTKPISATGHSYDTSAYVKDATYHWYECTECHAVQEGSKEEHAWDNPDYETVTAADYGKTGSKRRTCTVCGYLDETVIDALVPSVSMVQEKIDSVIADYQAGLKAYQKGAIEDAKAFYSYLPDGDSGKGLIQNYDRIAEIETAYDSLYYTIAATYEKGSCIGDYAGSWEGDLEETKVPDYYDVTRINMEDDGYVINADGSYGTPGSAWDNNGFNAISLNNPASLDDAEKITFSIYNPNDAEFKMFCLFNSWDYSADIGSSDFYIQPGWNDFTLTIYKGCRNYAASRVKEGTTVTDIEADKITLMFAGDFSPSGMSSSDKCNRDFYVTPVYGVKTTEARINEVRSIISGITASSTKEEIEAAKDAYYSMSVTARNEVNYTPIDAAEAQIVMNHIDALPSEDEVTYGDKDAIEAVKAEYDALSETGKGMVTNYSKIEALLLKLEELGYVYVVELIDALPDAQNLTMLSGSAINNARKAYDSLSESAKAKVTNYDKLLALETVYSQDCGVIVDPSSYTYYNFDNYNGDGTVSLTVSEDPDYGTIVTADTEILTYGLGLRFDAASASRFEKVVFYVNVEESNVKFSIARSWWGHAYDFNSGSITETDLDKLSSTTITKTGSWLRYEMSGADFDDYVSNNSAFVFFKMGGSFHVKMSAVYGITAEYSARAVTNQITALPDVTSIDGLMINDLAAISDAKAAYDALSDAAKASVAGTAKLNALYSLISEAGISKVAEASVITGTDWTTFGVTGQSVSQTDAYGEITTLTSTECTPDSKGNSRWPSLRYSSGNSVDSGKYFSFFVYNPEETTRVLYFTNKDHLDDSASPDYGIFGKAVNRSFKSGWNYISLSPAEVTTLHLTSGEQLVLYNVGSYPSAGFTGWKFSAAYQTTAADTLVAMSENGTTAVQDVRDLINAIPDLSEMEAYHAGYVSEAKDAFDALSAAGKSKVGEELVNKLNAAVTYVSDKYATAATGAEFVPTGDYGVTFSVTRSENTERGITYELKDLAYTGDWVAVYYNNTTFDVTSYTSLKFWMYNPTDANVSTMVFERSKWSPSNTSLTVLTPGWNEISVNISDGYFPSTPSSGFFGFYMNKADPGTGWLISNLYAVK